MEIPLSQYSSMFLLRAVGTRASWQGQVGQGRSGRLAGLGLATYVRPPTSKGHNFFVRTPFWVLLDSMEIQLSQDSIYIPMEGSGYWC